MTTIHPPPSPVDDKPSPPEGVEAEVLYEDFVAYMSNKLSPSVSNAIMLAALQQHVFAQHIVSDHLARIARRRKARIDSDKTRLAAHGQIVDVDWPSVPVKQSNRSFETAILSSTNVASIRCSRQRHIILDILPLVHSACFRPSWKPST